MLLSAGFLIVLSLEMSSSRSCNLEGTSYICTDFLHIEDFHLLLPALVKKVTLIGTPSITQPFLPSVLCQDCNWTNITELSFKMFTKINSIGSSFLNGLNNLRFILISECYRLTFIDPELFESTPELEALYLDGDSNLRLSVVENALKGKVSRLKYLSLKQLQTETQDTGFIGNSFVNALKGKKLFYLDIAFANIAGIYLNETAQEALYELKYLNVSYSRLTFYTLDKSNIIQFLPNLEIADLSGCQAYVVAPGTPRNSSTRCGIPSELKYLFLNNIIVSEQDIHLHHLHHFTNCSDCNRLEVLDLSNNGLVYFNLTIIGVKCFMGLVTLNVSRNALEYISPSFIGAMSTVKILDISENKIHKMQHTEDFKNLLCKNLFLEELHLRKNKLSFIPNNFLIFNTRLVFIDLRDNDICKLSIELRFNVNLKMIYLGNNRLNDLSTYTYQLLEELYVQQVNYNGSIHSFTNNNILNSIDRTAINRRYIYSSTPNLSLSLGVEVRTIPDHLTIDLSDNPIACRCENVDFVHWIITTKIRFIKGENLVCFYGNSTFLLDRRLYESVTYECLLPGLVIKVLLITLPVIAFVIAAILAIIRIRSNRRKAELIANLRRELSKRNPKFRYVVFVPYCGQDSGVVEKNILPSLRVFLQKALNTKKEVVCTGMDNFVPGRFIINEIYRCIDECLVVVPIVTTAFIRSSWSQMECSVAIQKDRKILILMEQDTDMSEAEEIIKGLSETYTRAAWSNKEGKLTTHPSIELVCERIIKVAAQTLNKQKHYAGPDDLIPLADLPQLG